jgi:FkbM family methyltransferase
MARPATYRHHGVQLDLTQRWATPAIRDSIYHGYYEEAEAEIVRSSLSASDRYLEVGAGIGFLGCVACQIAGDSNVTLVEANPELEPVLRSTTETNGCSPEIVIGVLSQDGGRFADFFVASDFWGSRLHPPLQDARAIQVPVLSFAEELAKREVTFLNVDIEGGEVDLLNAPIPESVRKICVETHAEVTGDHAITRMLSNLIEQGFVLDTRRSHQSVLLLLR